MITHFDLIDRNIISRLIMIDINFLHTPFYIQTVALKGRVLLAPMDGFTDSPFRRTCQTFGSSLNTSEFINGIDVENGHPHLKYHTYFLENERPFSYQIFDDDPQRLLRSALKLEENKPDLIDINMGCSAKNVSNRGAGAGLLKDPQKIGQIITLLVKHLKLPITAKIRLGWDNNTLNYLEVVRILQDSGVSAITVHARTRKQEFSGRSDWNAIAEIKQISRVPVIGNGDVESLTDAVMMIKQTGCDAVMIGRSAIGNPWIFSGVDKEEVPPQELFRVMESHLRSMCELYPPRIGTMMFRKHLARYLRNYLSTPDIRRDIFSIEDPLVLLEKISSVLGVNI